MDSKAEITENEVTGNTTPVNGNVESDGIVGHDHALGDIDQLEKGLTDGISAEHIDYLISRHGTTDLVPLPTMDPADPLNWPAWKVFTLSPGLKKL
jgi:hypothetical protein